MNGKFIEDEDFFNEVFEGATFHDNGDITWELDGKLHRLGGPAQIFSNGARVYKRHGIPHRIDGPAYIAANGSEEYWIDGRHLSKQQFDNLTKPKSYGLMNHIRDFFQSWPY